MEIPSTVFCHECHERKPYRVMYSPKQLTIKGITFSYVEASAFCKTCGSKIYVPFVADANADARDKKYFRALEKLREVNDHA